MGGKSVWDQEIEVPASVIECIDQGVKDKVSKYTQLHGITPSGKSYWARTAKIDATDEFGDGPLFIKVYQGETGRKMAESEYKAMILLFPAMSMMMPRPIAWGAYKDTPDTWFYLCQYFELSSDVPGLYELAACLGELQRHSARPGDFSLDLVTYGGRSPKYFPPCRTWEETFSKGLQWTFDIEEESQGPDEEMRRLRDVVLTSVVPRLLRPLEAGGRKITPTLVHGDLWDGHASDAEGWNYPVIFNGTPLYAHHEYEVAPWWASRSKMNRAYIDEYIMRRRVSEPEEDFEDQGALYSLYVE